MARDITFSLPFFHSQSLCEISLHWCTAPKTVQNAYQWFQSEEARMLWM